MTIRTQDDSDASAAAASHAAAESYESEEPSSDEDAPAALCVDLGASLVHSKVWERWRRSGRQWHYRRPRTTERKRRVTQSDEGEQLTALVKAGVHDLSHIGCKSAGVNHYSAFENQPKVLVRLMTSLISSTCHTGSKISKLYKIPHFWCQLRLVFAWDGSNMPTGWKSKLEMSKVTSMHFITCHGIVVVSMPTHQGAVNILTFVTTP